MRVVHLYCGRCGLTAIPTDEVTLWGVPEANAWWATFECPSCFQTVRQRVSRRDKEVLTKDAITRIVPAEVMEPRPVGPIANSEQYQFFEDIDEDRIMERVIATIRIRSTIPEVRS